MFSHNCALFETMLLSQGKIFLLITHLQRIYVSATILGFDSKEIEVLLALLMYECGIDKNTALNLSKNIFHHENMLNDTLSYNHYKSFTHGKRLNQQQSFFTSLMTQAFLPQTLDSLESFEPRNFRDFIYLWSDAKILESLLADSQQRDYLADSAQDSLLRLTLQRNGVLSCEMLPLQPVTNHHIFLSPDNLDSSNKALYHKTTQRKHYEYATKQITRNMCFDYIYTNQNNEIMEGSRSNVIIQHNNKYYTPHHSSGLLVGTLRSILLLYCLCEERILFQEDLRYADSIFCINSVRGVVKVKLIES